MTRKQQKLNVKKIKGLIDTNFDARRFFFNEADERFLDWLWSNGFLDVIKEKSEDFTQYEYQTPELNYLVKVAEKEPEKVTDIILSVKISKKTFNPEVIDRFQRICGDLPASQLARIVLKIEKEKWIPLMDGFNQFGFAYKEMFATLLEAKDYSSILILAKAVLFVRPKENMKEETRISPIDTFKQWGFSYKEMFTFFLKNKDYINILRLTKAVLSIRPKEKMKKDEVASISTKKPFYFSDLSQTEVFKYLSLVDDKHAEEALKITTKIMSQVVFLGDKTEDGEVFTIKEKFNFYDVDFFDLELNEKSHSSYEDDVRALAATIKILAEKTIGVDDIDSQKSKELYKKYLEPVE